MIDINQMREREIIRYLGYKKIQPDEQVMMLIHQCMEDVARTAQPRHIYRRFALTHLSAGHMQAGGVELLSNSLERNLKDCSEVIFFAATLGHEIDRLMERYLRLNITKAAVLQSTAAEAIECHGGISGRTGFVQFLRGRKAILLIGGNGSCHLL